MKALICGAFAVSVLALPALSFAQSDSAVTRAQVRDELRQLEQAGYTPGAAEESSYPVGAQAAESRVSARGDSAAGYGGMPSGSSASGARVTTGPATDIEMRGIYFGGQ